MRKLLRVERIQDKTTFFLIFASCVCLILQLYSIPRNNTRVMSLANQGLLLLWYGIGGTRVLKQFLHAVPRYLSSAVWLLVMIGCSLLAGILERADYFVPNLTALLNFFILPIMLLYTAFYPISKKAKSVILLSNIVLSFVFIQLYHSGYRRAASGYYGEYESAVVTLGYPNPNQTAMFIFVCLIGLFVATFYFKSRIVKWLLYLDFGYLFWIMYQTESRTALLLMLIFIGLTVINRVRIIPSIWINISVLAPMIYALLALFFAAFFGDVMLWGESFFNGRENIYQRFLNNLDLITFVFGDFNRFRFSNLHNSYVSIAATAGIFSVAFFARLLKASLDKNYADAISSPYTAAAFFGMICIFLYSSTEAAFFVGGSTYAFAIFTVFAIFAQPYALKESQSKELLKP